MAFTSVPFLARNRYSLTVSALACAFFVASCDQCVEDFDISNGCLTQSGSPIFSERRPADIKGESAVTFEPNLGQADAAYDFVSSAGGVNMRLNSREALIEFPGRRGVQKLQVHAGLAGARQVAAEGMEPLTSRTNYLLGNDPNRWLTGVANFRQVRFPGVYPGIDVIYHGSGNRLEHDFVVAPGADPAQIRLSFQGAGEVTVDSDGSLHVGPSDRKVSWLKPTLYQADSQGRPPRTVEGHFKMEKDGTVRFEVGMYDKTKPLTIDPVLAYSTYFGGQASESASRVAVDASGNAYFTGGTSDGSFAVTPGAYKSASNASPDGDAILVKMSADGKTVLYTTHLGGSAADVGLGVALDTAGNIYLTGMTWSGDFPVTSGAVVPKNIGQTFSGMYYPRRMCFVSKLNNAGSSLLYSTYLGGAAGDQLCTGIGVDSTGNAYVTGATFAKDFPTANAVQSTFLSTSTMPFDAFVSKVSPDGTKLIYSTFLGGTGTSGGTAIAVDAAGNAYVTGATTSKDFPVTAGALQTTYAGAGGQRLSLLASGDAFVTKLDPTGKLTYSTFLGGQKDDIGIGITVDPQGNAYVAGSTMSTDFPMRSAFQTAYKGGGGDANYSSGDGFVAKLNPQGSALLFSTYLGGSKDDRASAIGVDSGGNIFVAGNTVSTDFPVTAGAQQATFGGESSNDPFRTGDAFFAQISPAGALVSSTYFGGSGTDFAAGLAIDSQGGIVVTGGTDSTNLFTTAGAPQSRFGGGTGNFLPAGDAFVIKFGAVPSNSIAAIVNAASYASGSVSPGEIVTIVGSGIGPDSLQSYQIASGLFQTRVANTQILFDGVPAPVIYVSGKQDAVVVPYSVTGKAQTIVTAVYNGLTSPGFPIPVTSAVPGLFSGDSSGSGQGAILNQDASYNSAQLPAARGSIVVLYGTGEGQTSPGGLDGAVAASSFPKPLLPVSVTIGGQPVDPAAVLYAGAAPNSIAGLFQVNVKVPCSVKAGNAAVVVQVGTGQSQKGITVAVRDPTSAENYCPGQ
jgi:uncharacterized protein (TIGR03437 family)